MKARERHRKSSPEWARASAWGKYRIVVAIEVDTHCPGIVLQGKQSKVKQYKGKKKRLLFVVWGCHWVVWLWLARLRSARDPCGLGASILVLHEGHCGRIVLEMCVENHGRREKRGKLKWRAGE